MISLKKLFDVNEKTIKSIKPIVEEINNYDFSKIPDTEFKVITEQLKSDIKSGKKLDDILPTAFALVKEASTRALGMTHYDVQLMGGVILHNGAIAELQTGEGKTLAATLSAYLNALTGKGVHIITVNDYLAKRDCEIMSPLYKLLGLSTGLILQGADPEAKKAAYKCDITYGSNSEIAFDYLRDNMAMTVDGRVQRELNYAIIDEADSILIDEARTPLIISGKGEDASEIYKTISQFIETLRCGKFVDTEEARDGDESGYDYIVLEKGKQVYLTENGIKKAEQFFGIDNISDPKHIMLNQLIIMGMKAHGAMKKDIDYIVRDGEILIVDEFTGRVMPGRKYSEGLHPSIEAKEGVPIKTESVTISSTTYQNFFKLYNKVSGMTGTASTEKDEFLNVYGLEVITVPTNKPVIREDCDDEVYVDEDAKFKAVVNEIVNEHAKGRPILIGTVSVEKSEKLSSLLSKKGLKHKVLNAKYHEEEAKIIAQAGSLNAITIATNMAGRGTDIILGGNAEEMAKAVLFAEYKDQELVKNAIIYKHSEDELTQEIIDRYAELINEYKDNMAQDAKRVREAGGLYVIGTERHESRRIDNQLRGRAGRQGDPGKSKFFLSLDDDIMRMFGSPKIKELADKYQVGYDEPIKASFLTAAIENAQRMVESRNFEIRKNTVKYDNILNEQRKIIYSERNKILYSQNMSENAWKMIDEVIDMTLANATKGSTNPEEWDLDHIIIKMFTIFKLDLSRDKERIKATPIEKFKEMLHQQIRTRYELIEGANTSLAQRDIERFAMLRAIDTLWIRHVADMEALRMSLGNIGISQKDPFVEYQFMAYDLFEDFLNAIKEESVRLIFGARLTTIERDAAEVQKEIDAAKEREEKEETEEDSSDKKNNIVNEETKKE